MGERDRIAIIIGGGAAGLSAAYHLLLYTNDIKPIILEKDDCVGGLAKTFYYNGNGTDIGPHRFFTKNEDVFNFWEKILPLQSAPAIDDKVLNREIQQFKGGNNPEEVDNVFLWRNRFSRIYYENKFYDYPIKLKLSTLINMGPVRTFLVGLSYLKSCFYKIPETNLESFMINRFGKRLYKMFFEGYTQKVWGLHPSSIPKEWGEQRIKGISLVKVVLTALKSAFHIKGDTEKSLIDFYYYPKLGSSQMWETMADEIVKKGGEIRLNTKVTKINNNGDNIVSVESNGEIYNGDLFITSMPIKDLISSINDVPNEIQEIANNLQYRDFILASYLCKNINLKNNTNIPTINNIAPDSWIYLQDDGIQAGRLDIMNNFSPYLVKDFNNNVLVNLEYFCNENDEFWQKNDDEILEFGIKELKKLNAASKEDIITRKCYRIHKAYPSYFGSYQKFNRIENFINEIKNLYPIGRNGQHKYNNMDHSVLSGIEAARIISKNDSKEKLWDINTDSNYQETA